MPIGKAGAARMITRTTNIIAAPRETASDRPIMRGGGGGGSVLLRALLRLRCPAKEEVGARRGRVEHGCNKWRERHHVRRCRQRLFNLRP